MKKLHRVSLAIGMAGIAWLAGHTLPCGAGDSIATFASVKTIEQPVRGDTQRPAVVTAVALAPGGKLLVTAGDDHLLRFWNPEDGRLISHSRGHRDWIRALAFSPDGKWLASGGDDRRVALWNVATGERLTELPDQQATIYSLAFSADGKWLASAGFEASIYLYDMATRRLARTLAGPCSDLRAVAFSADSQRLAAAGRNGQAILMPLDREAPRVIAADRERIRSLAFSPDGKVLATGSESRLVKLWNAETGDAIGELASPTAKIMAITFCGEQQLATGGSDNAIVIWNLGSRTTEHQFLGQLESRDLLLIAQEGHQLGQVRRGPRLGHHHRAHPFAGVGVGDADHRHVGHRRQGDQQVLDLLGRDVLPLADDHVLEPPGDDQVPPVVESAQVAGAEEAVGGEGLGVRVGPAPVAIEDVRPADLDLAPFPRDADLDARGSLGATIVHSSPRRTSR